MEKCPIPKEREEMIKQNLKCSGLDDCKECEKCSVYCQQKARINNGDENRRNL